MMSDASDMLAAALEQMDGIIAGKHLGQVFILLFGFSFLPLGGQFQVEKGICWVLLSVPSIIA